jgi:hypothetical protein
VWCARGGVGCSVVCVLRCDPAYARAVVVVFVGHFFWGKGCVGCASRCTRVRAQVPVLPVVGSAYPYSLHALITLTTLPPMSLL